MTAPQIKIDIVAGENTAVPALKRTGDEIARVASGASSGLTHVQRLGRALALEDARGGSLLLRSLRTELVDFASTATGASTGAARLLEAVGVFGGPEIALGVAAVGGLVALYRNMTSEAREAAEETRKLKESVLGLAKATPEARQVVRGRTGEVAGTTLTEEEARLPALHLALIEATHRAQSPLVALAGTAKQHADEVERARKAYADQVEKVRELAGALHDISQPGALETVTVEGRAILPRVAGADALTRGTETFVPRTRGIGSLDIFGRRQFHTFDSAGLVLAPEVRPEEFRGKNPEDEEPETSRDLHTELSALLALVSGAKQGGGAAVSGVGSAASLLGTLTTKDAAGKLTPLIPGLGQAGTLIQAFGSLTSLFHSGKAKVTVTAFDEQARKDLQALRGDPTTTQFVVLSGTDPYALARLAARGVIPRFPGGR